MKNGTYVYGVVEGQRAPSLGAAPAGLAGAGRPRALAVKPGRWVVAADVPLERYGEESLARGLRDLDWVGGCALAHEGVVEYLARRGPVVPMKLFTIFHNDERAIDHVARARGTLDRAFRRIADAAEWSVRVFRSETAAGSPRGAIAAARSGAEFLREKKRERDTARARVVAAASAAETAHRALKKIARGSVVKPPMEGEAGARLIVDAAYLVPNDRRAAFRTEATRQAGRCRRAGCTLTLTGPWPAYHFIA
jgi:hypothetical protein